MQELISKQLVKYLVDRGVEYIFGLCGHTNIAVLAELEGTHQVHQHATRTDRRAHGGRLRKGQAHDRGRPVPSGSRPDERINRGRQRGARLRSDGRHRGRYPELLLRQASAPGSQSACRCGAVRNLSAVRQARMARRPPICSRRSCRRRFNWPSGRPGPVLVSVPMDIFSQKIDTALVREAVASHAGPAQANARRSRPSASSGCSRAPSGLCSTPAAG